MTYYYNKLSGTITAESSKFTKQIINPLYNIIIQEILELNDNTITYKMHFAPPAFGYKYDALCIIINNIYIYFCPNNITIHRMNPKIPQHITQIITIPYEQYTTLKQLIATHT